MKQFSVMSLRLTTLLLMGSLVLSGCSGSSSESKNGDVSSQVNTDTTNVVVGNNTIDGNNNIASDPSANTTRVTFDITVPVYVSNQLQVKLAWGGKEISANWVVDESWAIAVDFQKNTEHLLTVTFSDGNGAVTLGTLETNFRTQSNDTQAYVVTADQFDTARWDSDNDGVSNLSESISGTGPLVASAPPVAQAVLELLADKTIRLSWVAVVGAQYYRVLENQYGVSGYTQISTDLNASVTAFSHRVALFNVVDAQYIVQARNSMGCTDSNELTISGTLDNAITYIKASNTGKEDHFGTSVSLSADGSTLAVGAPQEDSNATGVDGDQSNNSALYSGAVYLFARINDVWEQQAYLKASNGSEADFFGHSVSLSANGSLELTVINLTILKTYQVPLMCSFAMVVFGSNRPT